MNLSARDAAHIWHPFTQHRLADLPLPIKKGSGSYLYDENGKSYLDLISSWWVNLHGHAHPEIARAIYDQALELEHVIFSGFTHEPAVRLAELLLQMLPPHFGKIFFSDNGSTAVETALKMSYQYWQNKGETQRQVFLGFQGGYHGDTFGAMSVSQSAESTQRFRDLLFGSKIFSFPEIATTDALTLALEADVLTSLDEYLRDHHHTVVAMIIEPLVQGFTGMRMCTPRFVHALDQLLKSYGILTIYDEVMTGFGRTGKHFGCLVADTKPDFICVAKGITGGFLPLAATACTDEIYQAFLGDTMSQALLHGHSYTANPLGCAAALASCEILLRPETQQQIAMIGSVHQSFVPQLNANPALEKVRVTGTIAAFNLKQQLGYLSKSSYDLRNRFAEQGLLLRPFGQVIYLLPPYCITETELTQAYHTIIHELEGVTA